MLPEPLVSLVLFPSFDFEQSLEDTQDIAFVIFSVVVGMAIGSGDMIVEAWVV